MSEAIFVFEDVKSGGIKEVWMDREIAPRIGETLMIGAREFRRLPTIPQAMVEPSWECTTYQFSDAQCAKYGPRDRDGRPRQLDAAGGLRLKGKEIDDMQARMRADGLTKTYDRGQFSKTKRTNRKKAK
jgi:hypothetical protein